MPPRKPTRLKQLQGTAQPCRTNKNEAMPIGQLGMPPKDFEPAEKKAWNQLSEMVAPGVLTNSDGFVIEIVARMMAKLRDGTITGWEMNSLMKGMSQCGLTPADRSKITVVEKKKESTWGK